MATRFSPGAGHSPAPGQGCLQELRGLAILVGIGRYPRDSPNSGWMAQAWGSKSSEVVRYRKIPKISPGAYIFQRPFLTGLFLEGLIFGGAYLRREICVSKSIGLAL